MSQRIGNTVFCFVICMILGLSSFAYVDAQDLAIDSVRYQTPYTIAKPAIERSFGPGSSLDQRRRAVVKAAEVAYGSRARAALGNSVDVLAKTPGGMKIARELAIMNPSNRKGALRAARVAGAIDADSRFKVVDLEQLVRSRNGAVITDRDIVFRHRGSGSLGRIEVKDAKPLSQKSNLAKYKRQIDLMAAEQRRTGQPQAFVNRKPLTPELARYAASKGVPAYGNVSTSASGASKPGNISITQVLDDIDRFSTRQFRMRAATTGFGLVMVAVEGGHAYRKWNDYLAGNGSATEASYYTLMASSGASFALGGVSSTLATQLNASGRAVMVLGKVGRYAGPVGYVLMAGAFGLQGYQYYSGDLNTRQFVYATSTTGGALGGGIAGAFGGGALGTLGGPAAWFTVPAGAIIGGIAGAWVGQTVVTHGVESYYSLLDRDQQAQLFASLQKYYQTKAQ